MNRNHRKRRALTRRVGALCCVLFSIPASRAAESTQLGICWVAATEPVGLEDFEPLLRNRINWISQTTFGWHRDARSPKIQLRPDADWWGESDAGIIQTAALARQAGIKTLLKPHIWGRHWSGDIAMRSESAWSEWFENYRKFALHYANLAENAGIEAFCIGTELQGTTMRENDWRAIIADVRKVYKGPLMYAANWSGEFEQVRFWDALDFIGIQAYFPVAERENPTVPEMLLKWEEHIARIEAVHKAYKKPVVITEVGYRSESNTAIRPWEWEPPQPGEQSDTEGFTQEGLETQADCYQAFFKALSGNAWLAGTYIWKWHPPPNERAMRSPGPFTPQGRPAEAVLRNWYHRMAISD